MADSGVTNSSEASIADPARVSKLSIYVLGLIGGLQMADPTIANIALVGVGKEFGFSGSQAALAASISTLALAATVLASGLIADRIGRRKLLIGALLLAALGDLIAAFAPATGGYMLGRALAGVGLGAGLAATFAYVRFVAPEEKVGTFLGIWNAVMLAVMLVGAIVGGILADSSWRLAIMFVSVLALIMVPIALKVLPPMPKNKHGSIDYLGLIMIGLSTVLFLYGMSQAARSLTAPSFLIPTALGIVGFAAFAFIELKIKSPVFPIKLFLQGIFLAAVLLGILWNMAQAVIQLASSNWWQYVAGASTSEVSLLQLPFLLTVIIGSLLVGRLLSARPANMERLALGGVALCVVGFLATAVASADGSAWWIIPGMVLAGAGLSAVAVPQSAMFVAAAPKAFFGAVTSFRTTVGQIGFAVGLSGSVVIIQLVTQTSFSDRLAQANVDPSRFGEAIDKVQLYMASGQVPEGKLASEAVSAAEHAYSHGFDVLMVVMAGVFAVLGILAWLAMRRQHRQTAAAQAATSASG